MLKNQKGFTHILALALAVFAAAAIFIAFKAVKNHHHLASQPVKTAAKRLPDQKTTTAPVSQISWYRGEGGVWLHSGTPPACPNQPILASPVDLSLATSILYPGQVRGNAFKSHGGFRFDNQPNNNINLTVPMDAQLLRGAKGLFPENGEVQYGFEFMAPCGIWYAFGHIHTLSPQFQAYADKLPLISQIGQQQFYDIPGRPSVKKGDVIATQVGIIHTKNVFVEWEVQDARQTNGKTIRPAWSRYADQFGHYSVCWLDWLPAKDAARAHALPGGDSVSGKQSDFCT